MKNTGYPSEDKTHLKNVSFFDRHPRREDSEKIDYLFLEEQFNKNIDNEFSRRLHR